MLTPTTGVLQYDGRTYAVGLLWLTVQDENTKRLLAERLKATHADFYCTRIHISQQHGFGSLAQGHKRGMGVAAAMVADQLVGEWHGVFEADNGWWYVQVRSDTIMPHGDRFFTQEEDAYNVFQEEMGKHNWPHAYAPAKWRLGDQVARELPLKNLLDELGGTALVGANMSAVFGGQKQRNSAFMALGAIGFLMAALILKTIFFQPEIVVPKSTFVPRKTAAVLDAPEKDNVEIVLPRQMVQQCGVVAGQLMVSIPGWKVEKYSCDLKVASMDWKQVTGTLNAAKESGQNQWPPAVRATFKQRIMTAAINLDKLPTIQQEKLLPQDETLIILERDLQPMGALQIKPVIPPPPPVARPRGRFDGTPPPPPPVTPNPYLDIKFVSGFAPEKFITLLNHPGFEVQKMDWNITSGVWQYQFKWSYAKPIRTAPVKTDAVKPGTAAATPRRPGQPVVTPAPTQAAIKPVANGGKTP